MVVSGPLRTWLWLLQTKPPLAVGQWLWAHLVGSRGSQVLLVVADAMLLLAAVQAPHMRQAAGGTLMFCGFYSCSSAHAVYLLRRERARKMLTRMLTVAEVIEDEAAEDDRLVLARAGRAIRWMTTLEMAYMAGMVLSVWLHVLVGGRAYAPMWPPPALPTPWDERAIGYFEMVTMFLGCLAYFSLITLFGCIVMALTGLYRALSLRLETARGWQQVVRVVQLHQRLNREAREAELFFADTIAHIMVAILIVPLVATLQVVFNVVDPLTFMSSSIMVSVFLPMASISQDLTDASHSLSKSAYLSAFTDAPSTGLTGDAAEGTVWPLSRPLPVLEPPVIDVVDVPTRRALLLVMVSATRPARISLKGLGPVSLRTARKALRVWYQWGNMLVSISSG